ncbi:E3 ubiquitin-protein ligase RNF34-like [Uloborus diversus]|uniref:E3 ubiquitin-protein ligase RNF34-like n=1 Tax=Uloborus diversus TaxID=327109 RepID=UPI00240976D0|nr:E3 ubiquitin-protein ligase RNF34-like [Uloborus diversus]
MFSISNTMACEGCSIRFTILRRKKKCDNCGLIFCSECVTARSKLYQCYRCKVLTCVPLNCNDVASLKLRDLQWFLDFKGIEVPRNDLREKAVLVEKIMNHSRPPVHPESISPSFQPLYPTLIEERTESLFNSNNQLFTASTMESSGGSPIRGVSSETAANQTATDNTNSDHNEINTNQSDSNKGDNTDTSAKEEKSNPKGKYQIINLESVDSCEQIYSLSIMELKLLLTRNSISFRGCCEKSELQEKVVWLWKLKEAANNKNSIPDENLCKICMEETIDSLLLDCGHMLTCYQCGKRLHDCPICRQIIIRVVRAFKS